MSQYPKHKKKHCPRCKAEFECKSASILLCQCQTIYLSPEQMEYVSAQFDDCLCASCLQVLRGEYSASKMQKSVVKINRHQ
jgi:Cysteine-rich CWC